MKYNVPPHSWKALGLTAMAAGTVGAKYMSTCQTETSVSGAMMLVYSREMRRGGESPEELRENKHLSHKHVNEKAHLHPLSNNPSDFFYHILKHM